MKEVSLKSIGLLLSAITTIKRKKETDGIISPCLFETIHSRYYDFSHVIN